VFPAGRRIDKIMKNLSKTETVVLERSSDGDVKVLDTEREMDSIRMLLGKGYHIRSEFSHPPKGYFTFRSE